MTNPPRLTRRALLQLGGAGLLAGLATTAGAGTANASRFPAAPTITDLGPGIEQFALMSAVTVGDTIYIGTRNVEPTGVIAFHVPTRTVTAITTVTNGHSVQAMAADPSGTLLYFGVLQKAVTGAPNLFRWDLRTPEVPPVALGSIGDRDVRDIAVAPDGVVFAVGGGSPTAPALWQHDPATGQIVSLGIPDAGATLARAVAATDTAVFFGAGSTLGGGGTASRASLFAYDRSGGTFTSVIPDAMTVDPSMRELAIMGDRLLASTAGSSEPAKLASFDLADLSSFVLTTSTSTVAKSFAPAGDVVYLASDAGLVAWHPSAATAEEVDLGGLDLGEIWGLDMREGTLLAVSGYGFVAEVDAAAPQTPIVSDLGAAGAPVTAQTCMGIAVGGGYAYVGGNGGIARHALASGEVVNLRLPGEAKDAEVIDGVLYTGQYNAQGIWAYDPASGAAPAQVADFPSEQNRPLDTTWDEENGLLLVAAQADTEGGGSLWTFDPTTGTSSIAIDPIDDAQLVRAVAVADGVAYIGGDNAQATGPRGTIVAWDPVASRELWRIETAQPRGIASLAVQGRHLFALTVRGVLVVIDRVRQTIVHTSDHRAIVPGFSAMARSRGVVYAASDTTLFRIDPRTFEVAVVVPAIDGGWYSGSHLAVDGEGRIYTLRGRNLVCVDDRP